MSAKQHSEQFEQLCWSKQLHLPDGTWPVPPASWQAKHLTQKGCSGCQCGLLLSCQQWRTGAARSTLKQPEQLCWANSLACQLACGLCHLPASRTSPAPQQGCSGCQYGLLLSCQQWRMDATRSMESSLSSFAGANSLACQLARDLCHLRGGRASFFSSKTAQAATAVCCQAASGSELESSEKHLCRPASLPQRTAASGQNPGAKLCD